MKCTDSVEGGTREKLLFIDRVLKLAMDEQKFTINDVLNETNTVLLAVSIFTDNLEEKINDNNNNQVFIYRVSRQQLRRLHLSYCCWPCIRTISSSCTMR